MNVVSTYEEFSELENDWRYVFEESGTDNIFLSWEWCELWWRHYGKEERPMVLVVEDDKEIIAIAPLVKARGSYLTRWKPIIRFIADDILADYMDFLVLRKNDEVVRTIIDFIVKQDDWGRIDLQRIPEASPNMTAIKEYLDEPKRHAIIRIVCISPIVKLEGAWEDYYKSLSKGFKRGISNFSNKLERVGKVSFEVCDENFSDFSFEGLYEIHKKRQDYKVGKSIFESRPDRDFYSDLAMVFGRRGWLALSVLKVNNRIISYIYGLKYRGTIYCWIQAIDTEYFRYSPGKLHIKNLLAKSFEHNYKEFDFMIGDEPYKFHWAKDKKKNYEIRIYRNLRFKKSDQLRVKIKGVLVAIKNRYGLLGRLWIKASKFLSK